MTKRGQVQGRAFHGRIEYVSDVGSAGALERSGATRILSPATILVVRLLPAHFLRCVPSPRRAPSALCLI